MKNVSKYSWAMLILMALVMVSSCKKKETTPAVIASFIYKVDAVDFTKVTFTNQSQNYVAVSWNFGDNTPVSNLVNPVHSFTAVGQYTVKLTAVGSDGTADAYSTKITITDPNAFLTLLVGQTSKTWKLLRSTATGRYPLQCGPEDHSTIWWAMGKDNNELGNRPCMLNDEWTFGRDYSLVYNAHDDYWAEGGIFLPDNICASTTQMLSPTGQDLSAWNSGTHTFELLSGTPPMLKANGLGAFVGFIKLGNGAETKVPLESVTYNVLELTEGPIDTLIIEGVYRWDPALPGGYWRFVLMHYDNPADEPPMPGNKPNAGFTFSNAGLAVSFANTSAGATSYLWDFGDGQTSTASDPVHTYAVQGIYNVLLTATNSNGSATATAVVFLGKDLTTLLGTDLVGNAWKVKVDDKTIFVGGGMGQSNWWSVPKAFFTGGGTGGDDWSCMPDDQFVFTATGGFTYNTMGSARNDGYFGTPNGCWSDADIAASPGAAFGTCATHTYTFTPANGTNNPIITLTSGAGYAAFIGFYKGYYGGENSDNTKPPNGGVATNTYQVMGYANSGTKEYLFVSVDISAAHDGSSAWSAILER